MAASSACSPVLTIVKLSLFNSRGKGSGIGQKLKLLAKRSRLQKFGANFERGKQPSLQSNAGICYCFWFLLRIDVMLTENFQIKNMELIFRNFPLASIERILTLVANKNEEKPGA